MRRWIRLVRPKQWIKNLLVFVAPVASGDSADLVKMMTALGAFGCFSVVASGLYAINDARDFEQDRCHPRKALRPIACGEISPRAGLLIGAVLLLIGVGSGWLISSSTALVLFIYCVTTLGYSFGLKSIPVLELSIVASGFVLRAISGATATDLPLTNWFLLVALFGSFFIVAGKRFAEVSELGPGAKSTRSTNGFYRVEALSRLLTVACIATLAAYCIFALDRAEQSSRGIFYELTVAPFCVAVLRYLWVLHQGGGGEPEQVFVSDRWLQVLGVAWLAFFVVAAHG